MNTGWFRVNRKLFDNEIWYLEPFTKGQAWIDLVGNANHKNSNFEIRGNIIEVKRGQIGWSELTMSKRWKWSRNKVRRYLKWLETIQQIEQQKDRYLTTIITILNYDKYQNDTADDTAERQQTIQQTIHKQECIKNVKNDKEITTYLSSFNEKFKTKYQPTSERVKKLNLRLKIFTLEEILKALENLSKSEFHQGNNDRGWKADADFLIRSDEQVDKWLNSKPKINHLTYTVYEEPNTNI